MNEGTIGMLETLGFVGYFSVCGGYALERYFRPTMEGCFNYAYSKKLPEKERKSLIGCISEELSFTKKTLEDEVKQCYSRLWKMIHYKIL